MQKLLGIEGSMRQKMERSGSHERNQFSVIMELQADCFAGVWATQTQQTKNVLESGDIEEALSEASAVGDDRVQKAARGEVVPDSFTHGSFSQRAQAFKTGLKNGETLACLDAQTN